MNLLLVDYDAVGMDLGLRACGWGHAVRWWFPRKDGERRPYGAGCEMEVVDDWRDSVGWADLIFPTCNHKLMGELQKAREEGHTIFGPSWLSAKLETDREYGMQVAADHGMLVPPYKSFADFDEAIAYVKRRDEALVSKPFSNDDKALSYVSKSPKDLVWRLTRWKAEGKNFGPFVLQDRVEGPELGVSCWMGLDGWIGPPNENLEFKKLMPGDLGINTGETGTVMRYLRASRLFNETLKPMAKFLRAIGHLGDIDVNCKITPKGPAFLEFTARPGWPAFSIMQSEHAGDPVKWMLDAAKGKDTLEVTYEHAVGMLMWFAPWPYPGGRRDEVEGIPLYGIEDKDLPMLHFHGAMRAEAPNDKFEAEECWCACDEYTLVATGLGPTVKVAAGRCEELLRKIEAPCSPAWRNDIGGSETQARIEALARAGYGAGFRYG